MMKTQNFNVKMIAAMLVMCLFAMMGLGQETGPPQAGESKSLPDSIDRIT